VTQFIRRKGGECLGYFRRGLFLQPEEIALFICVCFPVVSEYLYLEKGFNLRVFLKAHDKTTFLAFLYLK
jgi:hypothetical protein